MNYMEFRFIFIILPVLNIRNKRFLKNKMVGGLCVVEGEVTKIGLSSPTICAPFACAIQNYINQQGRENDKKKKPMLSAVEEKDDCDGVLQR